MKVDVVMKCGECGCEERIPGIDADEAYGFAVTLGWSESVWDETPLCPDCQPGPITDVLRKWSDDERARYGMMAGREGQFRYSVGPGRACVSVLGGLIAVEDEGIEDLSTPEQIDWRKVTGWDHLRAEACGRVDVLAGRLGRLLLAMSAVSASVRGPGHDAVRLYVQDATERNLLIKLHGRDDDGLRAYGVASPLLGVRWGDGEQAEWDAGEPRGARGARGARGKG